jgi:acyl transferase domain-containing protein/NADPH:quinone reductase-like Zn-dependent oxidoreductase/aryl carrier-like protein
VTESTQKTPDYAALLKRSLQAIDQLEAKLKAAEQARHEPIAIVGIGCRFPGDGDTPEAFWRFLESGTDGVTEVPKDRWDADACFDADPDVPGKSYTRWGAFVKDVDRFDAHFFGISPREAVSLDPQQRLLLEVTWESLEHAGIAPSSLAGSPTAVYMGITTHDYANQLSEAIGSRFGDAYTPSGTAHSVAAGRLSYFLGLHGPNVAIDTACSSSLVAIHWAVQSLRNGEANLAIAGGVNLTLTADGSILTSRARMMSFDGRCKTFDDSADGYVRGEGCGVLVLKRLSDAQRDGDRIVALVRGSALNQDGRSSGLTAPNGTAQEAVIRAALANARVKPDEISYVEAHGTGTPLGDPIEVKALHQVYGQRPADTPLMVGSVKTNIGHLEAAAGVAGVIKVAMALQHRTIPPHLHLKQRNHLIAWDEMPITVPTVPTPWSSAAGQPRRASVSSFGFSGTNAHVVLEEAPVPSTSSGWSGPSTGSGRTEGGTAHLFVLSAQTPVALEAAAGRLAEAAGTAPLDQIAATLVFGRSPFIERLAVVADSADALKTRLTEFIAGTPSAGTARGRAASGTAPELVFLFTGQGAQYAGMGRALYEAEPVFRAALDDCERIAAPLLGRSLLDVVWNDAERLDDTAFTQPALFAVEYALAQLWQSWGVKPTAVMGHSVGEYVAACVAGVFSLADGLKLIVERGRLMGALPRDGAMAAVFSDEATVRAAIARDAAVLAIAAANGPQNTVISGRTDAVDAALERLAVAGIESQRLKVSHAFHSPLMEPMLDAFEAVASQVEFRSPQLVLASNVTGRLASDEVCNAGYWRRHVRDAVRFGDSIAALQADGLRVFIELGPQPTLLNMAQRGSVMPDSAWIPSLRKGRDDVVSLLDSLGQLFVRGVRPDWAAVQGGHRPRAALPTYPFQREHYWQRFEPRSGTGATGSALGATRTPHALLGGTLASPLPIFQSTIALADQPWLVDHRIFDFTLFPATGFLELMQAAAREVSGGEDVRLQDLAIREGLVLPEQGGVTLQVVVTPADAVAPDAQAVQVFSRASDDAAWRLHASATLMPGRGDAPAVDEAWRLAGAPTQPVEPYYDKLDAQGAHYGPAFRGITSIARDGTQVLGRVQLPAGLPTAGLVLHPALLDACLQLIGLGLPWADDPLGSDDICVPVGLAGYRVFEGGAAQAWCQVRVEPAARDADVLRADLTLLGDDGRVLAELSGLELRRITREALQRVAGLPAASAAPDWAFETEWRESPFGLSLSKPASASEEPFDKLRANGSGATANGVGAEGRWLVLADRTGVGATLATRLKAEGAGVALVYRGDGYAALAEGWQVDAADSAQIRRAIDEAAQADLRPLQGVVVLWALVPPVAHSLEAMENAQALLLGNLLHAAQALGDSSARRWLVTRGAQPVQGSVPDLVQATVWGLGGVIASEAPLARCVRIDLDPVVRADEAELLFASVWQADAEDRIALRDGTRLAARLVPGVFVPDDQPLRLEITERGSLENLALQPVPREAPGAGQVEIRVFATGLNFRDVLNALGMYPGDPGPLGNECSGVITAVGSGVDDLQVGDEVIAMVDRSFATWVLAPASLTVRKPPQMSFAEAATIPVTFLTAEYALKHLAGMKKGDRVLLHAVTGGVGMAAAQLAKRAGAEIFGTAGSPHKRALAQRLGVQHVADSRSLSFVDDVLRDTNGGGVDIVLNSLAGDFIPASLRLLKPGGHFIEIGKTGIWDAARVADEFPGRHYHPLYLGEIAAARPLFVREMLQELLADFATGVLQPLPQKLWPIERAEEAFRYMGQGHHVGKIVVTQHRTPPVRPDASYLVSGGLSGLGLVSAQWLAAEGARHLVLVGRRAPSPETQAAIDALRADGVQVLVAQADVADTGQMTRLVTQIAAQLPRLRGVIHAAGLVDDGMLAEQDMRRFARVMAPKVRGTWNLHELTANLALDFFIGFSSGAALLGSPGQGNYAAANSFVDALAHLRRSRGQHALSIDWGSWSQVGMAAGIGEQHRRRWAAMGLAMIAPHEGVAMMKQMLASARSPQMAAMPLVRARLPRNLGPFFSELVQAAPVRAAAPAGAGTQVDILAQLAQAPAEDRLALLVGFLSDQIVRVLALPASHQVDPQRSLMEMGMDSLMAMELRNRIQTALKVKVAVAALLKGPSIAQLAASVLADTALAAGPSEAPQAAFEEGSL